MVVKKILSILILGFYVLSGTECYQFLKIGFLVQHYQAQKQYSPQDSFVEFLMQHYSAKHDDDGDSQEDMKLPFKSCIHDFSSNQMIVQNTIHFRLHPQVVFYVPTKYMNANTFLKSSYLAMIWQPPRIV